MVTCLSLLCVQANQITAYISPRRSLDFTSSAGTPWDRIIETVLESICTRDGTGENVKHSHFLSQFLTLVQILSMFFYNALILYIGPDFLQIATFMKLKLPPKQEEVEFPAERRKLKMFERVPQPTTGITQLKPRKHTKDLELMRGPELVHNRLLYGKYGIQALTGGRLRYAHIEMIRLTVGRGMNEKTTFATWRVGQPWQSVTKKGTGIRMGGPKGNIDHYVFPVKAGRIIFEIGGTCEYQEVERVLEILRPKMPFDARIVTRDTFDEDERLKQLSKEKNINPFSFEYCIKNNFSGVKVYLSPYDFLYDGTEYR